MTTTIVGNVINVPSPAVSLLNVPFLSPTQAANVGTGQGLVFRDKVDNVLNFRRLLAGTSIMVSVMGDDIEIAGVGGASPWMEAAGVISQVNIGSQVVMGAASPPGIEEVSVVGDQRISTGSLITPAIDDDTTGLALTTSAGGPITLTPDGTQDVRITNQLRVAERAGDPASVGGNIFLYAKDVAASAEAFIQTPGGAVQVTSGGSIPAGAGGADTQVQFNSSGNLAGNAAMTFVGTNFRVSSPLQADGGVDVSAAGDLALGTSVATSLSIGSAAAISTDFSVADNVGSAWTVSEGANVYMNLDTFNGGAFEKLSLGFTSGAGKPDSKTVLQGSNANSVTAHVSIETFGRVWADCRSLTVGEFRLGFTGNMRIPNTVADNVSAAWQLSTASTGFIFFDTFTGAKAVRVTGTDLTWNFQQLEDTVFAATTQAKFASKGVSNPTGAVGTAQVYAGEDGGAVDVVKAMDESGNIVIVGPLGTITGSRAGNAALADLLTTLAAGGWIVDSTTA